MFWPYLKSSPSVFTHYNAYPRKIQSKRNKYVIINAANDEAELPERITSYYSKTYYVESTD